MRLNWTILAACCSVMLTMGCVGQGGEQTKASNTTNSNGALTGASATEKPQTTFRIAGVVNDGKPGVKSKISVFDGARKLCGNTQANEDGSYTIDVACNAPFLLAAEAVASEGDAYYGVVIGSEGDKQAVVNLSPISTAITALMMGTDPRLAGSSLVLKKIATESFLSDAKNKVRAMLMPALKAFGAEGAELLNGDFGSQKGLVETMQNLRLSVDADNMVSQYTVTAYMPFVASPIIMKNSQGAGPTTAIFDTAYGVDPGTLDTAKFAIFGSQIEELANKFKKMNGAEIASSVSKCFMHDGFISTEVLTDFGRNELMPGTIRVEKFNVETVFGQEDNALAYQGQSNLAYVSMDAVGQDGRKKKVFMWLTNGDVSSNNCSHEGKDWSILGNQRKMYVKAETYLNFRDMYDFSLHKHEISNAIGLEFFIGNDSSDPMSHVLVTGPGLPLDGVVFVNNGYDYVMYSGSIQSLRQVDPAQYKKVVIDNLKDTKAVALTDEIISPRNRSPLSGIVDRPYDPHNKYTFRVYKGQKDLVPAYIYRDTLNKRPYLTTEVNIGNVPTLAIDRDELVAGLVNFTPVRAAWSLPSDNRGVKLMSYDIWMGRVATLTKKECSTPTSCTKTTEPIKAFTLPGSYRALKGGDTSIYMQGFKLEGDLDYGYARIRTMDSFYRPVESEIYIQMTSVKPKI